MSFVAVAIGGSAIVGAGAAIGGSLIAANSANEAQKAQQAQMEADRAQTERAIAAAQQAQSPFAQAGQGGLSGLAGFQQTGMDASAAQRALMGLDTPEAQQAAIEQLQNSPQFASMLQQGENAILQNASATGGLRGGNTQAALAQFRPALLSQIIQQRLAGYGGLAGAGQNAATTLAGIGQGAASGQAAIGLQGAGMTGNILQGIGAAQAGGILAQGQAASQGLQGVAGAATGALGAGLGYNLRTAGPQATPYQQQYGFGYDDWGGL